MEYEESTSWISIRPLLGNTLELYAYVIYIYLKNPGLQEGYIVFADNTVSYVIFIPVIQK